MTKILDCPECEDRDCQYNALGLCYNVGTVMEEIPGGMFTCSGANFSFENKDWSFYKKPV